MLDLRQSPKYAKYMEGIGWRVEKINGVFAYIRKIPIVGNVIKIQRPEKIEKNKVRNLVQKYRPFQIFIEPINQDQVSSVKRLGFKASKSYFVPSKTIHIDLTKSENLLLKEMHYKTRYNIKKINHQLLTINYSSDIKSFADFWQKCALKQRGMFLSQKNEIIKIFDAFAKNAQIVFVQKRIDKEILAGILLLHSNKTSYYMYAAASDEGKKHFAPTIAAWEAIRLSKKTGSKVFDFEGIYDERFPLKSWLGFTRFKKSFGGHEVEYPGAFVKTSLPFLNL